MPKSYDDLLKKEMNAKNLTEDEKKEFVGVLIEKVIGIIENDLTELYAGRVLLTNNEKTFLKNDRMGRALALSYLEEINENLKVFVGAIQILMQENLEKLKEEGIQG